MREAAYCMNGLAFHYYTRIGDKSMTFKNPDGNEYYIRDEKVSRGSATEFGEKEWFEILASSWRTEELVAKHSAVMDIYDPEKKVALVVDEWGTWFDNEPGTNPGFLYQQNTLRDAVSAAISLNIFNNHAERVRMTNIAQTVNVLQAMVLTEGAKMILTPTYHVFDLFKEHQNGTLLPVDVKVENYTYNGQEIPGLSISSSKNGKNEVFVTIVNPDPSRDVELKIEFLAFSPKIVSGRILSSGAMQDHNTFTNIEKIRTEMFKGTEIAGGAIRAVLPSKSVVSLLCRGE
jgi:alpha-N-arabinofuranosidase